MMSGFSHSTITWSRRWPPAPAAFWTRGSTPASYLTRSASSQTAALLTPKATRALLVSLTDDAPTAPVDEEVVRRTGVHSKRMHEAIPRCIKFLLGSRWNAEAFLAGGDFVIGVPPFTSPVTI